MDHYIPGNEYHETIKNKLDRVMAYWISITHLCASRPWKRQDLKFWTLGTWQKNTKVVPWMLHLLPTWNPFMQCFQFHWLGYKLPMQWFICWRHFTQGNCQDTAHVAAGSFCIGSRRKRENTYTHVSHGGTCAYGGERTVTHKTEKERNTYYLCGKCVCVHSDPRKMCVHSKNKVNLDFFRLSLHELLSLFASLIPPLIWKLKR